MVLAKPHFCCSVRLFLRHSGERSPAWDSRWWLDSFNPAVGVVLQHPADQLIGATVAEDVAFGPENLGCSPPEVQQRVHQALAKTGTSHLADRMPHQLSGGEQRMVAIAGILAMQPQLILYDEPTAFLDQRSCGTLIEFLQADTTPVSSSVMTLHFYAESVLRFFS